MTGIERIAAAFERAREEGRAALMPYLMGGYPDADSSAAVIDAYAGAGADLIELGVPFSDPLADGPVIHAAATKALTGGATFASVLALGGRVADRAPVVAMVYSNMVLAHGADGFADALFEAGLAGAIVPDLPPEEAGEVREALATRSLALVPLVAPTTPPERRRAICASANGFVYVISDTRTTGERDSLPAGLAELVAATKRDSRVPVAVGFGIGTPEQAAEVGRLADGVIIGSRLVRAAGEAGDQRAAAAVSGFLTEAVRAMGGRGDRGDFLATGAET